MVLTLGLLTVARLSLAQTWDRPITPGIVFRMERQSEPQRNIYGLRIDPRLVRAESVLAKGAIYDLSPQNGRAILSNIVREHEAIGGVNGDFFQWGDDPGGNPMNLMVHGGELLSHPGSGNRGFAVGWGSATRIAMGAASWEASFTVNNGSPRPIQNLNARADDGEVTLLTDTAAYVYAGKGVTAAFAARVRTGAYRLGTNGTLQGNVIEVVPIQGRVRVAPGEFLLTGVGKATETIRTLKPGDKLQVRVQTSGFDWSKVSEVMGGGPVLLLDSKNQLPSGPNNFNDTRHPRTALGQTADGSLWLIVVDGRQTMSVGASLAELTEIMRRWGCVDAINLDGGGSSAINLFGVTLNRPSGGVERAVANGVLLYGDRPASERKVTVRYPDTALVVGQAVRLEALLDDMPVAAEKALFAAQGAGWIDQEGNLHPTAEGNIEVTVLVEGVTAKAQIKVNKAP
jgi:hypothetical protein